MGICETLGLPILMNYWRNPGEYQFSLSLKCAMGREAPVIAGLVEQEVCHGGGSGVRVWCVYIFVLKNTWISLG
jgi:hypothetical protein